MFPVPIHKVGWNLWNTILTFGKNALWFAGPNERGQVVDKSEIDLIHVPGLVFQSKASRIGYGGGYYDRYLADYTGKTVSTIYSIQQKEFQPDVFDPGSSGGVSL